MSAEKTKKERLQLILKEIRLASSESTEQGVLVLLERCFDEVEDTHTAIPKNPLAHLTLQSDGRMYAPHVKFRKLGSCGTAVYRQFRHRTYIGSNGAFAIYRLPCDGSEPVLELRKRGADGQAFWERPDWEEPPDN